MSLNIYGSLWQLGGAGPVKKGQFSENFKQKKILCHHRENCSNINFQKCCRNFCKFSLHFANK